MHHIKNLAFKKVAFTDLMEFSKFGVSSSILQLSAQSLFLITIDSNEILDCLMAQNQGLKKWDGVLVVSETIDTFFFPIIDNILLKKK